MTDIYAVAMVVSALLGAVAVRPPRYAFWFARVEPRWWFAVGVLLQWAFYALAGGLVVAFTDTVGLMTLANEDALIGLLCGLVPHGLAAVPLPPGGGHTLRHPKSWIGRVLHWIAEALDFRGMQDIEREVRALEPEPLIVLTWDLYWEVFFNDRSVPDAAKDAQHRLLEAGASELRSGRDTADGLGRLRNFCIGAMRRRHLA